MVQLEQSGRIQIAKKTEFIRYHKTLGELDLKYFKAEQAYVFVLKSTSVAERLTFLPKKKVVQVLDKSRKST